VTSYRDAEGTTSAITYDLLGRKKTTSDGKSTQTFGYNANTGFLTSLEDSVGTFTASYDPDGNLTRELLPNGHELRLQYDETRDVVDRAYVKTQNCSSGCTALDFSGRKSIHDQWLHLDGTAGTEGSTGTRDYTYDAAGRLTESRAQPAGRGCTVRRYGYDGDSNRTLQKKNARLSDGSCDTSATSTAPDHTYDAADRLTPASASDAGIAYDDFGRTTTLPGSDAGGGNLSISYYVNDMTASLGQGSDTRSFTLDPAGRHREMSASGVGQDEVYHYSDNSDSPAWIANPGTRCPGHAA
jgi:YD repeat-containing protein